MSEPAVPIESMKPGSFWYEPDMRSATVSLMGVLTTRFERYETLPPSTVAAPRRARIAKPDRSGALVTNLTRPPSELAPYSAPCGPRSTSMRARSKVSKSPARIAPLARPLLEPNGVSSR